MLRIAVKVTPSNQTLILASERRGSGTKPGTNLGKTPPLGGSVLQRVTIVAAQSTDTLIYLSTDYAKDYAGRTYTAPSGSSSPSTAVVAISETAASSRDSFGNSVSSSRYSTPTSYLKPVEQYARTQRMFADVPRVPQIDVYA